ncbi:MAG: DUF433 domain-containing protein [Bryobacterales bacterium]|nr:DUF433 domain-containing protein [Bryobacterales bacterium]
MTERIETNPAVMLGKPVIRNTRIPVELILRKLAEGAAIRELLDAYPRLSEADIRACLAYAADAIAHEDQSGKRRPRSSARYFPRPIADMPNPPPA